MAARRLTVAARAARRMHVLGALVLLAAGHAAALRPAAPSWLRSSGGSGGASRSTQPLRARSPGLHPAFADAAALRALIARLPKAELHLHIEGTLEVDLMFKLARRNGAKLPYADEAAARAARASYSSLEDFINVYRESEVLRSEDDFEDLMSAYLTQAASNNVTRAEIFFDVQNAEDRGIPIDAQLRGMRRAIDASGADVALILTFDRTKSEASAAAALAKALPWVRDIDAVGLASAEVGFPPSKFKAVYAAARFIGLHRTAHAGEEAGPEYIREALDVLRVERVDHGIHVLDDPALVARMAAGGTPITLCPVSNLKLQVYKGELEERLRQILASGVKVTINSDDPAFFGAYVNGAYEYIAQVAGLGPDELAALAVNSFEASFMPQERKAAAVASVLQALQAWKQEQPAPQQ